MKRTGPNNFGVYSRKKMEKRNHGQIKEKLGIALRKGLEVLQEKMIRRVRKPSQRVWDIQNLSCRS